jgi:DNA ligase-1
MNNRQDDDDKVSTLQSIIGQGIIPTERAHELLEAANGSLERAIDIYFHQQQQQEENQDDGVVVDQPAPLDEEDDDEVVVMGNTNTNTSAAGATANSTSTTTTTTTTTSKKRPPPFHKKASPNRSSSSSPTTKQARLDIFFGAKQKKSPPPPNHHPKSEAAVTPPNSGGAEGGPPPSSSANLATSSREQHLEIINVDDSPPHNVQEEDLSSKPSAATAATSSSLNNTPGVIPVVPHHPAPLAVITTTTNDDDDHDDDDSISFHNLAETLQQLTDTTKRLEKLDILKNYIRRILLLQQQQEESASSKAQTLTCALVLLLGFRGGGGGSNPQQQAPMEVGGSALSKALQTILGASRLQLSKGYRTYGDMGDAAASLFQTKRFFVTTNNKPLTIRHVYESFERIVATEGRDAKQHIVLKLLRACNSKTELRFLVRLLIGNMRVGANLKTVLVALAMAFVIVPPNNENENKNDKETKKAAEIIQKTHDICPNLNAIIVALLKGGVEQVQKDCSIQLMTPIAPMLAHPTHSLEQIAKAMGGGGGDDEDENGTTTTSIGMTMEWKYDGVRCQVHYDGTVIKLFSRHMLETTAQYPDAAKAILEAIARRVVKDDSGDNHHQAQSFILDAEIVGVEGEGEQNMRLLPFQDLSRRKKTDDGKGVRVKVFCFDLMYLNGVSYINRSLQQRQAVLKECFRETDDFAFVSSQPLATFDEGRICAFLEKAVKKGAEGLMLKVLGTSAAISAADDDDASDKGKIPGKKDTLSSYYEAGTRSHSWLKVKQDYVAGDTIDVVPIGAWYGNGRKAQKSFLSPVLLAVYDEEDDVYRSISRCMSFTDAMYDAMREFYFRGTAYPPGVGMEGTVDEDKEVTIEANATKEVLEVVGEEGGEPSDEEEEGGQQNSGMTTPKETGPSGVNCSSNRPSSAYVITNESPPIWFKPMEVFEVSFADMSLSRQHTAGAGLVDDSEGRGVALRFPRFKRRRPDKKPEQATTSLQIAQLFSQQAKVSNTKRA